MSDQPHDSRKGEGTTVAEAARLLSITEGAVRKRVERGNLAAERTTDGRLVDDTRHDARPTATVARRPLHPQS
jgi:excisionase family DNA binding protein